MVRARKPSKNVPDKYQASDEISPDTLWKDVFRTRIPVVELVRRREGRFDDVYSNLTFK